ncbi:hypothetical protein ACFQI7_35675 [Paenibacillus allorhizosphaerae]|nr:hypothetical protein [Paenibacillus allorhizosphaerae]
MNKPFLDSLLKDLEDFVFHAENNDETLDSSIQKLKEILKRTLNNAI